MRGYLIAAALIAAPAFAQAKDVAVCRSQAIVPGFEGWGSQAAAALTVGKPATLRLAQAGQGRLSSPAHRPLVAATETYSGDFALTVAKAGTYRIALAAKAWIDVERDGKVIESGAHQPGPACSGITKIVDFALEAGTYRVRIDEAPGTTIGAMVVGK